VQVRQWSGSGLLFRLGGLQCLRKSLDLGGRLPDVRLFQRRSA